MKKIKTYALITCSIEEAIAPTMTEIDYTSMTTTDPTDIVSVIEARNKAGEDLAKDHCIEIYYANEEGDFVEGSDFDSIDNFVKRFGQ